MRRLLAWLRHEHYAVVLGIHLEMARDLPFAHFIEGPLDTPPRWRETLSGCQVIR